MNDRAPALDRVDHPPAAAATAPRTSLRAIFPTVAAASLGFAIVQLDVTVVNVAIPSLGQAFGSSVHGLQWIVDAYTLSFAALLLTSGTLADRFGSRRLFAYGLALFLLASLGCALAPSLAALVAARVAQGVGAAMILPTSLALITHACANDAAARVKAVAWWSATGGAISAAGPTLGGLLIDSLGWRAIFFINLPICALGLWLTLRHVRDSAAARTRLFDPAGQIVAVLVLGLLTGGIIRAGAHGISDPYAAGALLASAALGALFVAIERRVAAPMLQLACFRIARVPGVLAIGAITNAAFYGLIFSLSLYFQNARGFTATESGLALAPLTIIMLANIASARLAVRYGFRATVIVGLAVSLAGYVWLWQTLAAHTPYALLAPGLAAMAVGGGIAIPALTSTLLGSVEAGRSGTASAILNTARQVGAAIGVAALGALVAGQGAAIVAGAAHAFAVAAVLVAICVVLAVRWPRDTPVTGTRA
ncbi:MFS transporter [Burkholderia cenocepacia]|uniref:MFS transporter n=1 Tax=Burkholderia cenocepacia TaxID=95486 RepID=UPI00406C9025